MPGQQRADDKPMAPYIRGQERAELIDDLARGERNLEQLAESYGRTYQTVKEFSARNSAEIQGRRQVLQGALAEETQPLWVADKVKVAERYQDTIDDLYAWYQNTDDGRLKSRFARDLAPLMHAAADLYGHFPMRSRVDLDVKSPFKLGEVMAFGADGQLHEVRSDGAGSDA
jgi:hypothetical protein